MRYYWRNKKKIETARLLHKRDNIPLWLWKAAKARAVRKGLEFTIGPEDIVVPIHCPALGFELKVCDGKAEDFSPSLDRIDNSKGYIKGNVQVISNKANRLKGDATKEDFRKMYDWMNT